MKGREELEIIMGKRRALESLLTDHREGDQIYSAAASASAAAAFLAAGPFFPLAGAALAGPLAAGSAALTAAERV